MNETTSSRPRWAAVAALIAVVFGIVTVLVGGKTLFGGPAQTAAAGNIVPFILWFNFIAGFAYIIAGYGVFRWKRWAAQLSLAIAITTVAMFGVLAVYIALGGAFEARTIGAMTIRSLVWIVIAAAVCRAFECFPGAMSRSS
jgi:hypothetical protein